MISLERQRVILDAFVESLSPFWKRAGSKRDVLQNILAAKLSGTGIEETPAQKDIIIEGENIAIEAEREGGVPLSFDERLIPIFENIFIPLTVGSQRPLPKEEWRYPLARLRDDHKESSDLEANIFPKQRSQFIGIGRTVYPRLWQEFLEEAKQLPAGDFESVYHSFYYLALKYTWCIPSDDVGDLPVFDVARITSALSDCLFEGEKDSPFLYIYGDISGIQDFLYKMRSPQIGAAHTAVRLRGRSFYLSLLTETFANYLIDQLELCFIHLIWIESGNFLIIAPNTLKRIERIKRAKEKINRWLYLQHKGQLALNLVAKVFNRSETRDFAKVHGEIILAIEREKGHKFLELSDTQQWFGLEGAVCPICESDMRAGREFCLSCKQHQDLGGQLVKLERLFRVHSRNFSATLNQHIDFIGFPHFGIYWKFNYLDETLLSPDDRVYQYEINQTNFFPLRETTHTNAWRYGYRFLANAVAFKARSDMELEGLSDTSSGLHRATKESNNKVSAAYAFAPLTFDELADASEGIKRLGVLRMDMDNLGAIFSLIQPKSIVRGAALSRMLELFFSWYLDMLCERPKIQMANAQNKRYVYITYSGGDDLLITGAWNNIVDLAAEIESGFRGYTCQNEDIHLSGGIFFGRGKFPIHRGAYYSGEALHRAKGSGQKNALCIFDTPISWREFEILKQISEELIDKIRLGEVGRGFLYKLLRIYLSCQVNGAFRTTQWLSQYTHLISRNLGGDLSYKITLLNPETEEFIRQYAPLLLSYVHYRLG